MRWAGTKIMSVKPSLTNQNNQNYTQNTHAVKGQVCREIVHIPELKKTFTFWANTCTPDFTPRVNTRFGKRTVPL